MGSSGSKKREPSREDLRVLLRETSYDKETICAWYSAFRRHSSGRNVMKVEDMARMCSLYEGSHLTGEKLASLLCEGEREEVRFTDFLTDHYVATRGSQRDRLARLFRLCDADKDGLISSEDLTGTLSAWSRQTDNHSQVSQLIFTKENRRSISEEQFITQCELLISDQALQVLL